MNALIIGDIMLDHYLLGDCSRISPEAPVPVVNIRSEEWRLGGAANVAKNLVALNVHCTLIGVCGEDLNASMFEQLAGNLSGLNSSIYKSESRPTIVKSRVLVGGHQMIRLDREQTHMLNEGEEKALLGLFLKKVETVDMVILSDYNKGTLSRSLMRNIFLTANTLHKPTIVDPKSADFSMYSGATFIKPNRKEAELATAIEITNNAALLAASRKIKHITGVEAVITTLSEDGVCHYADGGFEVIPTKAQKVFDVTGAGDTFLAAFAFEYMRTNSTLAACEFANLASAVVVAKIGSSTATLEEIERMRPEISIYETRNH